MHGTPLKNTTYKTLLISFENWLKTLEYAQSTVYGSVRYLEDFLIYLQQNNFWEIELIDKQTIKTYHEYLQTRKNKRQPGSLSQSSITSNINVLRRFSRYLQATGKPYFEVDIKTSVEKEEIRTILTKEEIKALYKACSNDILGIRDRAMLAVYYGCGLRRNEGTSLDVKDILLKEKLIYVQKGKGYKERYVPMSEAVKDDIENYLFVSREKLQSIGNHKQDALFISMKARRMHGNSLIIRLQKLAETTQINKTIGLHTLRHSIATHLLQSGMNLENVSKFLGHQSIESTQIYTHISNE